MKRLDIIKPREGLNFVKNPSFEAYDPNTSNQPYDWSFINTGGFSFTWSSVNTNYRYGMNSLYVHKFNINGALSFYQDLTVSTPSGYLSAGIWFYCASMPANSFTLKLSNQPFGGSVSVSATNDQVLSGWNYITCSGLFPTSTTKVRLEVYWLGVADVWLDGCICEAQTPAGTFFDGSFPGCRWDSTPDRSYSYRETGSGGVVYSLSDNKNQYTLNWVSGFGMPTIDLDAGEFSNGDGGYVTGMRSKTRQVNLAFSLVGQPNTRKESGNDDLLLKRGALSEAFRPKKLPNLLPSTLVFRKTNVSDPNDIKEREIDIYYQEGLGIDKLGGGITDQVTVRCISANEPYWRESNHNGLDVPFRTDVPGARAIIMRKPDGTWTDLAGGFTGFGGSSSFSVRCVAVNPTNSDEVFIGGSFISTFSGVISQGIVKYKISTNTFTAFPNGGLNGIVNVIAFDSSGDAYIGGTFTATRDGVSTLTKVAKYNALINTWSGVGSFGSGGSGINTQAIYALAVSSDGKTIFAGGDGSSASYTIPSSGAVFHGLAKMVITGGVHGPWTKFSSCTNSVVYSIAYSLDGNSIYVGFGGTGGTVNGTIMTGICQYDVSTGTATIMGASLYPNVNKIYVDKTSGFVYAAGTFSSNGIAPYFDVPGIAYWNGYTWVALGLGTKRLSGNFYIAGIIYDLTTDKDGNVLIGGEFTHINGKSDFVFDGLAKFDGTVFNPMDIDLPNIGSIVTAVARTPTDYTFFGYSGTTTDNHIAVSGAYTTVNYAGSAPCYPSFRFVGPGTIMKLRNDTTGQELNFGYTLASGEILEVNLHPNYFKAQSSFYGNVGGKIFRGGSNSIIQLDSSKVGNRFYVYLLGSLTGTKVYVYWQNRYYSIDD